VLLQVALLIILTILPGDRIAWLTPGTACAAAGIAIVAWASLQLGPSLTPLPDPKPGGIFTAAGPYRFVRHPIYSGVILAALGFAAATSSVPRFAMAIVLIVFFDAKSRYEERALRRTYPQYAEYARRTRRFLPFLY
jgi:protein-S-isoprenylcysteine O-methyltransferase Ste14